MRLTPLRPVRPTPPRGAADSVRPPELEAEAPAVAAELGVMAGAT